MEEQSSKTSWKNRLAIILIAGIAALTSLGPTGRAASQASEPILPAALTYFPFLANNSSTPLYPHVVARSQPAFDACHLPPISTLQTWWSKSPYRTVNLYLGGSAFSTGCKYGGLDSEWLSAADQMGWTFIPTWVGPQAPCAGFKSSIDEDSGAAFIQGRGEAEAAVQRARSLGFQDDLVIYLDIEAYARYNNSGNACRDATNQYLSGWVERLHELGHTAGAYGSSCGSLITSWSTIKNPPDAIWAAYWTEDGYVSGKSVMGILCLADNLWVNHQRIRQYAGDHNETWGGATLNIDSDITHGPVQSYGPGGVSAPPALAPIAVQSTSPQIVDFQLVAPGQGWALSGGRLLWTGDNGSAWTDITPAPAGVTPAGVESAPLDVFFLTNRLGWLAARTPSGELQILRTADGGLTWQPGSLPGAAPDEAPWIDDVYLEFLDAQTGWAAVRQPSGGPFSRGALYRTADSGATWTLLMLPLGEPVRFADALRGWVAGGAAGDQLYATRDGGLTWQQTLELAAGAAGQALFGLPVLDTGGSALLPVTRLGGAQPALELYSAGPDGAWKLAASAPIDPAALPASPIALAPAGPARWWASLPDGSLLSIAGEAGGLAVTYLRPAGFPSGATRLQFSGPGSGWTQYWNGSCSGDKATEAFSCWQRAGLSQTSDGGMTWSEIDPIAPAF